MKQHNGMRPHDVVVLSGVILQKENDWYMKDLAYQLMLSQSEISESLNRSMQVGLIDAEKRTVQRLNFCEFLEHGLKYVFPAIPGTLDRGIPTAVSAAPLSNSINSSVKIVWPVAGASTRGITIDPLYPKLPKACQEWQELYEVASLLDVIRMNQNAREIELAVQYLKEKLEL